VLERSGEHLEGLYTRTEDDDVPLAGDLREGGSFTLTEMVAKGKRPAVFEGKMDGLRITGTWRDPAKKSALPFVAGPLDAFGPTTTFKETYLGSLGGNLRVRMKLERTGGKLTGAYRYMKSKEDLGLEGTVTEADGKFRLIETTRKGLVTGRFEGIFVQKNRGLGRWSSPDGSKTLAFTFRRADVYPESVMVPGGSKVVPQEEHAERGKFCTSSVLYPEVLGTGKNLPLLNAQLKKAAGDTKIDCEGASDEARYESDTTYHVDATRPARVAVQYTYYAYSGGVHGHYGQECFAADLEKGSLTKLGTKLLAAESRKKLESLVNAALKKEHKAPKLTDANFFVDDVTLDEDTTLCVVGTDLVVRFALYSVAPYSEGTPFAKISAKDAAPLVAGTPLAPFFE